MNHHHHLAARRMAGLAVLAAGLAVGAPLPITALAEEANPSTQHGQPRPEDQNNRGQIQFAAGSTSGSVNGAVPRGDWDHWGARARRGQMIEVTVSATSGNATFELYTPSGDQMANDVRSFRGQLPADGNYAIDVGSTGGLANYTLTVTITGEPSPDAPQPPSAPVGQQNKGQIQFASGASSGSVGGTVATGAWHHWGARAQAGQVIQITINGNATFELYTPSGTQMANDVTSFSGTLPATGNYAIDVGSTGGTANYTLTLSITGSPTPPPPPPAPGDLPGHFQGQIQFAPGASSGSVDGTVERGDWHEWSFRANGGQQSTLTAAGNATFSLYAPNGDVLAAHTTSFSGTLPATGLYMIEVGPTGGSAAYTLNLAIT
jgi:hypothetical protein